MKVVDPGHEYLLDSYDGGEPVRLVFVKREGEGYPFNVGHHPGTNCQETWRASLARVQYLQTQEPCDENLTAITKLRELIWLFEMRAARRHGRTLHDLPQAIESVPTCAGCGHIGCEGTHKSAAPASPAALRDEAEELSREQVVQAITDIQEARESHAQWANHLLNEKHALCEGCDQFAAHIGDAEYHDQWIAKYNNVIAVLARVPFATTPPSTLARKAAEEILKQINTALTTTVPAEFTKVFGDEAGVTIGKGAVPKIAAIIEHYFSAGGAE